MGLWACQFLFLPWRLPVSWLGIIVSKSLPNWLSYKTKSHWRSVDPHFQDVAVTMLVSLSPLKAADTLVMDNHKQIAVQLTYLQDKKTLTLCWHSVSECGSYLVAVSFASKSRQSVDYEYQQANHITIKLLTSSKIIDALLTPILKMDLLPCCCPFRR
jgi:hypothetical protein